MNQSTSTVIIAVAVACLWGLHAVGVHLPTPTYFLPPLVIGGAVVLLLWRTLTGRGHFGFARKGSLALALACWFAGATLSAILNWQTPQVLLTYGSVFVVGAAIFVALSGLTFTRRDLDIAVAGLAAGALVPLIAGLLGFVAEWGMPDLPTAMSAYRDVVRMTLYEAATFGNRGNTAAFLVLLTPILMLTTLDGRRPLALRIFSAATLVVVACNLAILQVRAAFVAMTLATLCVWIFRFGIRRLPWLAAALASAWILFGAVDPEFGLRLSGQMMPVLTVDADGDTSVDQRLQAIGEGWQIFERHWLLGIGPGGALTRHTQDSAHQFQVQQAMEIGIFGLVGSTLFSLSVLWTLIRTLAFRRSDRDDLRFAMVIGPAAYVVYAMLANAAFNLGTLNVWTVLTVSMLALAPPLDANLS